MDKDTAVSVQPIATPDASPPPTANPANTRFFDWIQDEESKRTSIKKARTVPWLGIFALVTAASTALLSLALLYCVDDKATWSNEGWGRVTQPASWLSALISANSIALHVALTEGVTVAWWFRATRPNTTIRDLHKVWATGTSATKAAKDITTLNYVSLATLFVAIIPLNGFLLQGALFVKSLEHPKSVNIPIPMVKELPKGYSGWSPNATSSGVSNFIGTTWPVVFQQATNIVGSRYSRYAYFGNWDEDLSTDANTTLNEQFYFNLTDATWTANVPGAGFDVECTSSTTAYNHSSSQGNVSRPLFSSTFRWNNTDPNTIYFDTLWKPGYDCAGELEVRSCVLTAAVVEYPVQVKLNVSSAVVGPYYSLQPRTTRHDDKFISNASIYADEGIGNSTYGGIASSFSRWFGGNISIIDVTADGGGRIPSPVGGFASGLLVDYGALGTDDYRETCNLGIQYGLWNLGYYEAFNSPNPEPDAETGWLYWNPNPADPSEVILEQIRQAMFLASVYQGSTFYSAAYAPVQWKDYDANGDTTGDWWVPNLDVNGTHYVQNVEAQQIRVLPTYGVRYYLWGASLALTYAIILVVLPTFWGYWILKRKPTMSPVDMARAFSAPVVTAEDQHQMQVDALLRQVGRTPIHNLPAMMPVGVDTARPVNGAGTT